MVFGFIDYSLAQNRTRTVVCRDMFGNVVPDSECPAPKPATTAACPSTPTPPSGCNWTLTITGGMGAAGSCGTTNFLCPQNAGTCSTPGQTQFRNNCGCDGNEWTAGTYTCQCQPPTTPTVWTVTSTERCSDYFAMCGGTCSGCAGYGTRACPSSVVVGQPCSNGGGPCYRASSDYIWFDVIACQ